jgi:hypothetical protein
MAAFTVRPVSTVNGAEYAEDEDVGSVPSVVYRITAAGPLFVIVTL